jgi:DNA helicase-2/ATP-dependent DNA helicase PcrA
MEILEGLNPEQRAAVEHDTGAMLVVAGAGTGKTAVITRRIAYLIQTGRAKPADILALTFTEKAAREMADRLHELIGWQSFQVAVLTFNAFGAELLGRYASHIGRPTGGGLLNTTQKSLLLQQHFDRLKLEYYGPQGSLYDFVETIIGYIERLQNAGVTAESYRRFVDGLNVDEDWLAADIAEQRDLAAMYELYETVKQETGTFDYSDQLAVPLEVLCQRPNLAERLTRQYKYVLVDEYQDTSPVQDALLRAFVPAGGNIFAVGDDDQSIYGFRGADIANILDFADHFQVQNPTVLTQNYRSGQPILDASYRLIQHNNPERLEAKLNLDKHLHAQTGQAEVAFMPYRVASDEQAGVVEKIVDQLAAGEPASSMAVLARSNAVLRSYGKALRARGVPFALSTEVDIFEQRELINLWYLLQWLGGKAPEEAVGYVMMGPFIGWGAPEYRPVAERAKADLLTPEEALGRLAEEGHEAAAALVRQLAEWRDWMAEHTVSQLAYKLVFETGLSERLMAKAPESDRVVRVFEDLHMLLGQMQDYETVALDPSLVGYLATFPKPPSLESAETVGDSDGVQLLTVHASKGLEFATVYLVGMTAKAWSERTQTGLKVPDALALRRDLPSEHEQRRLLYVAVTRAKRILRISAASETAGGQRQALSPYITELLGDTPVLPLKVETVADIDKVMQKLQRFYPLKEEATTASLPFENSAGWIELGVGSLDAYKKCPHEFYLQYVLGISQPFGPQLAFGTALHATFQAYYEARLRGETVTEAELQGRLDELWSDRGYETRQQADMAHEKARDTLWRFVMREDQLQRQVLGSELKITLEIPEAKLRLRGRIDAYFQMADGVEIRDFKTGMKRDAEKLAADAKDNFQLRTYALAYEVMTGAAPAAVTLDYVVTSTEGSAKLTPRILTNHRAKLVELAGRIRARDFAPAPQSEFHQCAAFRYYGEDDGVQP